MKTYRKKFSDFYKKHTPSVKFPLVAAIMILSMVPLLIQGRILASSSRQSQIERRMIDVQNQSQIFVNRLSRIGYLSNTVMDNAAMDAELSTLADIFNGRILIVDSGFRIVEDTFFLSEGKICYSQEVIRCFQGESTNKYNTENHYFLLTLPIPETLSVSDGGAPAKTAGVMMVTASTESMYSLEESLLDRMYLYQLLMFAVILVLVLFVVRLIMGPFENLVLSIKQVAEGNLNEDVAEESYLETKRISRAINSTFSRLKAVEQSRQEFVSNVSHELKTPITSIRVLADSLMGMEEPPRELYEEFMRDISEEIDRESKIIDDLLSLVKMDKTEAGINISQANVNEIVEMVLKRLRPIAQKQNIELIFESMREVLADVDEVKLSLAINNLVENAVKYNRSGGWVRVTLDADHKYLYLTVADSGIGIPEEFQAHVFERFYRVDKARSRETGGTGLGLAITKGVILMHRGTIHVESAEGEGTVFRVRLPLNYIS